MKPITDGVKVEMWQLCCVKGVDRDTVWATLGRPHFTETDSHATYGGEEDWWAFELESGHKVALALRVPYEQAVLYASTRDPKVPQGAFAAMVVLGCLETYEYPVLA